MRVLIVYGMLALASLDPLTSANARPSSGGVGRLLVGLCRSECGVTASSRRLIAPSAQVCVNRCVAAKKAAQH
jgi:hypothetical protein